MPSLGLFELIFLFAIALIFLGPKKLPYLAKNFAGFFHQLRSIQKSASISFDAPDDSKKQTSSKKLQKKPPLKPGSNV